MAPPAGIPQRGLLLWLAADGETRREAEHVIAWNDQSGNGNHATRVGKAPGPTLAQANGRPVLRFDGKDVGFGFRRLANMRTVFWVLSKDPASFGQRNERFVFGDVGFGLMYNADFHPGGPGKPVLLHGNTSAAFLREGQIRLNGQLVDGTTTDFPRALGVVSMVSTGNLAAGFISYDRGYPGRAWQGDLAEILVYDRVLADGERAAIEQLLARKYGLTFASAPAPASPAWTAAERSAATRPSNSYGVQAILGLAFSPDGAQVATGGEAVRLCEARTLRPLRSLQGLAKATAHKAVDAAGPGQITRLGFTPDGQSLLTAATDGTLRRWAVREGRPHPLAGELARPGVARWGLAISPDGATVAIDGRNQGNDVRRFTLASGQRLSPLEPPPGGWKGRLWSIAYSPDGKRLAASAEDRTVRLWNAGTGALENVIEGPSIAWSLAFSADSRFLAAACVNMTLPIWEAESGELAHTLIGHGAGLTAVAFSADGKLLASASHDATARLWQAPSGRLLRILVGHAGPVWSVAFAPDGAQVVTGGEDGVRSWDVVTGKLLQFG
jgi:hypothetical protein